MTIGKVEYRINPVTRYEVTRYEQSEGGHTGSCRGKGEYGNNEIAYEVAYALCKAEHEQLGWPIGDERIQYPERFYGPAPAIEDTDAQTTSTRSA